MSNLKSRIAYVAAASALVLGACATSGLPQNRPADLANDEQRAAAERADPLTRARFWAEEYQKEPEEIETATYFAQALRDIESHERAIQVASDTLILYPADYDILMLLGRSYLSMNKPDLAAQAFGRAIQANAERADAFAALGLAYDRAGQHQYAQRAYSKALAIDPERTSTLTNYGLSQALSGNIDGAERALRKAAENPDANSRVRQNLALVLGLQGKFEEMKVVDDAAPAEVMKKNADLLKQMIERQTPLNTARPIEPMLSVSNPVARTEKITSAPTKPVMSVGLGDVPSTTRKITHQLSMQDVVSGAARAAKTQPAPLVADVISTVPETKENPGTETKTAGIPGLRGSLPQN